FRAWATSDDFPQRGRISYINQQIVIDMSPEEIETHSKVKEVVYRTLGPLVAEEDLGEFFPDGTLVTHEAAGVSNEPDGAFVSWETSQAGHVVFVPRQDEHGQFMELEGSPDWVLEAVSLSSVRKDTRDLLTAYHQAGVREYWLIDARDQELVFQVLVWRKRGYQAVRARGGWLKSEVVGRSLRRERSRNRAGRWKYQLLVKS